MSAFQLSNFAILTLSVADLTVVVAVQVVAVSRFVCRQSDLSLFASFVPAMPFILLFQVREQTTN